MELSKEYILKIKCSLYKTQDNIDPEITLKLTEQELYDLYCLTKEEMKEVGRI